MQAVYDVRRRFLGGDRRMHEGGMSRLLGPIGRRMKATAYVVALMLSLCAGASGSAWAESGFVGLEVQDADGPSRAALGYEGIGGVLVRDIHPGGPGQKAGLARGDLLTTYEGVPLTGLDHLVQYMATSRPGNVIEFAVWRHGRRQPHSLTLGEWPDGWRVSTEATAVVPRVGLTVRALTPDARATFGTRWGTTGVVVSAVEDGGPAARQGVRPGDLVVAAGRRRVTQPADLDAALHEAGDAWMVLIDRGREVMLLGPGAPAPEAVVAGEAVLAVALDDGPYVLDITLGAPEGARPGGTLKAMPEAAPSPEAATAVLEGSGVTVSALTAELRERHDLRWSSRGVVVTDVAAGSIAQIAGLAPGHVIRSLNQTPVRDPADAAQRFQASTASHVLLLVETWNGYRLLSLGRQTEASTGQPTEVRPVFSFGKTPG